MDLETMDNILYEIRELKETLGRLEVDAVSDRIDPKNVDRVKRDMALLNSVIKDMEERGRHGR